MDKKPPTNHHIDELTARLEGLEAENIRLKGAQQSIAEVNNNYLMLHYLTRNIQDCETTQELWGKYLHNISDCGFNYEQVALVLPDEDDNFATKVTLLDGKVVKTTVRELDNYIEQAIATKNAAASPDNLKVALPMVGKAGEIKALLLAEKACGIFSEDLQLLNVYIRQTIATIENIMLNENLRQFQELLGRQLDQFVMLHYVTKSIHEAGNYYDVLKTYLTTLCSPMGFGFREAALYILADSKLQKACLQQGKLQLVELQPEQGLLLDGVIAARQYELTDYQRHLLMPLNSFGKITAIMEIHDDKEIMAEQIKILEIFAMQTSSAIDNTRLKLHLEYMSFHDQLTDLYNRAYFENEILQIEKKGLYPTALIVCDLDGLKMINDTCGHAAGDHFIVAAAKLIKTVVPTDAIAARIGGDEFVIIIPSVLADSAEQIALAIRSAIDKYNVDQPVIPLGMSVGWAATSKPEKMNTIFKQADSRMYQDKYTNAKARREFIYKTIAQYPGIHLA